MKRIIKMYASIIILQNIVPLFASSQTLSLGAGLLFQSAKTKISVDEKNDIFSQTGFYYNSNEKKLSPAKGVSNKNFFFEAYPTDMNSDGVEEILVFQGRGTGNEFKAHTTVFISRNGKYYKCGSLQTGTPEVFASKNFGYNDIGNTYPVRKIYRYNGSEYHEYVGNIGEWLGLVAEFSLDYTSPIKTISNPEIVAAYLFRDIKTKLSNTEKRFFAESLVIQYRDNGDTSLKYVDEDDGTIVSSDAHVDIFLADINRDGTEEVFMRMGGSYWGPWLQDLQLFIKDKTGKYVVQDSVASPRLFARATPNKGYPDLIASIPEGPGFYKIPTKFDVYRWDGTKYYVYKHKQPYLKTDKSIEEEIAMAYQKTLPDSLLRGNIVFDEPEINNEQTKKATTLPEQIVVEEKGTSLSLLATFFFNNIKSRLTDAEKNDIAAKSGINPADTARNEKGKQKKGFTIYPTDINSDGVEDVFLCITTRFLGIPENNYFFFTKDAYGNYQPAPGKIGNGVRILMNGKSGYPDLIVGAPGLNREVWSWNGGTYFFVQRIAGNVAIPYQTMDIDKASLGYMGTINNPARNAALNVFDGEWYSPTYTYSFRITGDKGIATLSNSANYKVGDVMLRITSFDGEYYHGTQIYTDGVWHDVTLKLKSKNEMIMKSGVEWIMIRKSN